MPTGDMVIVDSSLIRRTRKQLLLTEKEMALHLGVSFRTYLKARDGVPVQVGTARDIMQGLGLRHVEDVLSPESLDEYWDASGNRPVMVRGELPADWLMLRPSGEVTELSNGLRFQAWELCQRHMPERLARGKRYDLSQMAEAYRCRSDEFLHRHTRICDMLRKCPYVANNFLNMPDEDRNGWWVIDHWYQGPTIAEMIQKDAIETKQLPEIMRQIAKGLDAIHKAGVICRELGPEKIIYEFKDESIVLTDFETGKLFDSNPTVRSGKWPKNPYRAPEAEGVDLRKDDIHIDFYSWGRILVHAVTGKIMAPGKEAEALSDASLPKKVRNVALKCVDLDRTKRPKSAVALTRAIASWK
jgi:hypothetical protein